MGTLLADLRELRTVEMRLRAHPGDPTLRRRRDYPRDVVAYLGEVAEEGMETLRIALVATALALWAELRGLEGAWRRVPAEARA